MGARSVREEGRSGEQRAVGSGKRGEAVLAMRSRVSSSRSES